MEKVSFYRSIRFQIPVTLCIAILIPLSVLFYFNYASIQEAALESTKAAIQNDLSTKAISVDHMVNEVTRFAQLQSSDQELLDLVHAYYDAAGWKERRVARSVLTLNMRQRIVNNLTIRAIYLFIDGDEMICSTLTGEKEISIHSPRGQPLYADYLENKGMLAWSSNMAGDQTQMMYYRPLVEEGLPSCMLVFEINTDYVLQVIEKKAFEDGCLLVCDYRGNIMLQSGAFFGGGAVPKSIAGNAVLQKVLETRSKSGSYQLDTEEGELVVEYNSSSPSVTNWKYIEILNLSRNSPVVYHTQKNSLMLSMLIGICVSFLGAAVISGIILKPMNQVLSAMKRTENGRFLTVPGPVPGNELGVLIRGYNHMIHHLEELIENVYMQEISKREAQLKLMQSQMDEHFLYNTLNTIFCVMKRGDTGLASEMVLMLTRFFRLNLSEGKYYLKISEIYELIQCYLMIQKTRFGNRMRLHIKMEEDLADFYAVKYLFQPIAENAIIHGIESRLDGGEIQIFFRKNGDMLYFEVQDDGVGISGERLRELLDTTIRNPSARAFP